MQVFSRFVRYFDAAARQGSMRSAGATLHVSASAVDRQILRIEEEIGAPLFERQAQGLRLTSAGELVLHALRKWHSEMQALDSRIEDLKGLRRGRVVLATIEGAAAEFVAGTATDFHERYPAVTFDLQVYGARRVAEAVLAGDVDFGLTINPELTQGLAVIAQKTFRVGAVVPPGHPLAGRAQIRLSECLPYRVVVADPALELRTIVNRILARASARPGMAVASNSVMLMKEMVLRGFGVGLMTEMDADKEIQSGQLVYVALAERPIPPSVLTLCVNSERQLSLASAALLDLVKARMGRR